MIKEELKNLGATLRTKREERNQSLKEVENATSIRKAYLEAIEQGDIAKLISPIYAQGFIRQYAAYLDVDGEKIIRENPDLFTKQANQEFSYGIGTLETRGSPGSNVKGTSNFVWIGAFAVVVGAAWYLAKLLEVI